MPFSRVSRFGLVNAYLVEEDDGLSLIDTMIPEAFRKAQTLTGLVTVLGFVASYAVHQVG